MLNCGFMPGSGDQDLSNQKGTGRSPKSKGGSGRSPDLPNSTPPGQETRAYPADSEGSGSSSKSEGTGRSPKSKGSGRSPDLHGNRQDKNPKFMEGYHFITIVVNNRIPIFQKSSLAVLAIKTLKFYEKRGDYELSGFVVMPDHIHFVCNPKKHVSEIVRDIKKYIAKGALKEFSQNDPKRLKRFRLSEIQKRRHRYQIWQSDFYDFNILSERKLIEKLRYMYENPVRKGLCHDFLEYEFSDADRYFVE